MINRRVHVQGAPSPSTPTHHDGYLQKRNSWCASGYRLSNYILIGAFQTRAREIIKLHELCFIKQFIAEGRFSSCFHVICRLVAASSIHSHTCILMHDSTLLLNPYIARVDFPTLPAVLRSRSVRLLLFTEPRCPFLHHSRPAWAAGQYPINLWQMKTGSSSVLSFISKAPLLIHASAYHSLCCISAAFAGSAPSAMACSQVLHNFQLARCDPAASCVILGCVYIYISIYVRARAYNRIMCEPDTMTGANFSIAAHALQMPT